MDTSRLRTVDWKPVALGLLLVAVLAVGFRPVAPDTTAGNGTIPVTVTVNASGSSTGTVRVPVDASALEALNASHTVNVTRYSSGAFVTGIDDVHQNATHSWLYFVNGSMPSQAVDRIELGAGARVTFVYLANEKALDMTG